MAITRSVKQQYENYIAVRRPALDENQVLMYTAPLNADAEGVVRGSVVSINSKGEMVLGLAEGTGNVYPMPMFAKKNAYDKDVMTGAVGESTKEILATSTVGKQMTAYVATGGYEIETSEYDKDASYVINAALVDKAGKVTAGDANAVYGEKTVLGIVSKVPFRSQASMNVNGTGANRLCFWTVFFPPTRATAGE